MTHIYTTDEQREWHKNLPKKNISTHVLVCRNEKLLLLKPTYKNSWILPGGIVEETESPLKAAKRELSEEIGIDPDAHPLQFAGVSHVPTHNGFPERIAFTFLVQLTSDIYLVLQEDEVERAEWVAFKDILKKTGEKRAYYADIQTRLLDNVFPFYSDLTLIS